MSSFNVSSEMAREKLHGLSSVKQRQPQEDQQTIVKQTQSQAGFQWAYMQTNQNKVNQTQGSTPDVSLPQLEDMAFLSSIVTVNEKSVKAPDLLAGVRSMMSRGVNLSSLEESYKEYFRKSKSHNLVLERFMSNVKLAGVSMLMGLVGVPAEKIEEMKKEIRKQALAEIDTKLSQDWAYAKAMLEIMG